MKNLLKKWHLLLSLLLLGIGLQSQTAWERSVLLSATVEESPARIHLTWPLDPVATDYQVYKKNIEADNWGDAIAFLAGDAISFIDEDVMPGRIYEYAVFKKGFDPVVQNFCVPAGSDLVLLVKDQFGIGLCCNFGFGYYQLEGCGEELAYGDDFGYTDTTYFSVCDLGDTCENLTMTVIPDMFPNSTSWEIREVSTGEELASSGIPGSFITERPKYGFISAGVRVAPTLESRGSLLLLVDAALTQPLDTAIQQLKIDLIKDHWKVIIDSVADTSSVVAVRQKIQDHYLTQPDLKSVYLLGAIPVPYSGNIYPDTHFENHQGAWSADPYYAEMNGTWTDEVVNITTAFFDRNHNIPGDGKFDQDSIPSKVELQIGRVDLSRMPAFSSDYIELTRRYLQKAHDYRMGSIPIRRKALVDDNFGQAFAAPAASGWRNFAPMFGVDSVVQADYFSTLRQEPYLWSYGCGSGSHISAAGIGTTTDFAQDSLLSIFTMLFGSQFGDWDNPDNFLRAPLASGNTLTNCWAGNPPWTFHHMAMGYPIGYSTLRSMNSDKGVYLPGPQLVHMALMGDPSLRMYMIPPLEDHSLDFELEPNQINLSWIASPATDIAGYLVYRAPTLDGDFKILSPDILSEPLFSDNAPLDGENVYQVKVVRLEQTGSGSYYNQSLGVIDSIYYSPVVSTKSGGETNKVAFFPNPARDQIFYQSNSTPIKPGTIKIMDTSGKVWKTWNRLEHQTNGILSLEGLPSGLYFITTENTVNRIIIQ